MSLAGVRLGACEILAPIGAGGIGEVFRARDTKLGREVVLKVFARLRWRTIPIGSRFNAKPAPLLPSIIRISSRSAILGGRMRGVHFGTMELGSGCQGADGAESEIQGEFRSYSRAVLVAAVDNVFCSANYTAERTTDHGVPIVRLTDAAHGGKSRSLAVCRQYGLSMRVHGKNILYFPPGDLSEYMKSPQLGGVPFWRRGPTCWTNKPFGPTASGMDSI